MSEAPTSRGVTIVMYHYVRPILGSEHPGIKGREVTEFRRQVEGLRATHHVVDMGDVLDALTHGTPLPPRAALLTFDDGLIDHHRHVLPVLVEQGVRAAFYPCAGPTLDGALLEVHRTQFVLAAGVDPVALAAEVDAAHAADGGDVAAARARFAHASRWDPAETVHVKRMLQTGLAPTTRERLTRELFARHVSADEAAFARELYCSLDDLRELHEAGMHLGNHTDRHPWLTDVDDQRLARELGRGLELLEAVTGEAPARWTLAYPFGGHDDRVVAAAADLGCAAALTIVPTDADLDRDDRLRLPRVNTNDLPA